MGSPSLGVGIDTTTVGQAFVTWSLFVVDCRKTSQGVRFVLGKFFQLISHPASSPNPELPAMHYVLQHSLATAAVVSPYHSPSHIPHPSAPAKSLRPKSSLPLDHPPFHLPQSFLPSSLKCARISSLHWVFCGSLGRSRDAARHYRPLSLALNCATESLWILRAGYETEWAKDFRWSVGSGPGELLC